MAKIHKKKDCTCVSCRKSRGEPVPHPKDCKCFVCKPNVTPREIRFCSCGCGQSKEVKVTSTWVHFRGHHSGYHHKPNCGCVACKQRRGEGPWNKDLTKETDERVAKYGKNVSKTRREKVKRGELHSWCKGLTKETSEGVRRIGEGVRRSWVENRNVRMEIAKERGRIQSITNVGSGNPNWRGGISNLPYSFEFTEDLKESIRNRDGRVCQLCGVTEEEHVSKRGKRLTIHHINYDKNNSNDHNLISLCCVCNSRVNGKREYWKDFFRKKLSDLYKICTVYPEKLEEVKKS